MRTVKQTHRDFPRILSSNKNKQTNKTNNKDKDKQNKNRKTTCVTNKRRDFPTY